MAEAAARTRQSRDESGLDGVFGWSQIWLRRPAGHVVLRDCLRMAGSLQIEGNRSCCRLGVGITGTRGVAMTGHSGQSMVTVRMIVHRRADHLDRHMMHVRGSGRRRNAHREQGEEQAQDRPARNRAEGPYANAYRHWRPGSVGNTSSITTIDLLEAKTIRDYTYEVGRDARPFGALSLARRHGNAVDLPPMGSSSFIKCYRRNQQS